jgi:hypothetical protein
MLDSRTTENLAATNRNAGFDLLSRSRESVQQSQSLAASNPYSFEALDRQVVQHQRHSHSRSNSLFQPPQVVTTHEQQAATLSTLYPSRRADYANGLGIMQSPRLQATSATVGSAFDAFSASTSQQNHVQRQEPPKPTLVAAPKRSAIFGLLNDDPPEKPVKRPSTDSTQRLAIHTPSPQTSVLQPGSTQQHRAEAREDLLQPRNATVFVPHSQAMGPNLPLEARGVHSGSPAPVRRNEDWVNQFDRRSMGLDRSGNHSPYSVVPPSTLASTLQSAQTVLDPARGRDYHRHSQLSRSQAQSPPRQIATPVSSLKSSSSTSQHARMNSLLSQSHPQGDVRLQQQLHANQHQPASMQQDRHRQIVSGQPGQPAPDRGQPPERRSSLQDPEGHETVVSHMQAQLEAAARYDRQQRDEALKQGSNEEQLWRQQEMLWKREALGSGPRELHRYEQHRVVPPPLPAQQQPQPIASNYGFGGPPQRTYTPPPPSFVPDSRAQQVPISHTHHHHHHHHNPSGHDLAQEQQRQPHAQAPPQQQQFDHRDPRHHAQYSQQHLDISIFLL